MSENPKPQIFAALAAVMDDVQSVAKKDKNTQQGFNFRGIDAVVNAVGPALRKHKVIVTPCLLEQEYKTVEVGKNRTQMGHVIVKVKYTFYAEDGSWIEATVVGEAMDSGDKAVAKAMSVAFRIALLQSLALPTDEPDPDSQSYERSQAKPQATAEQYASWIDRMDKAFSVDELKAVGVEAAEYDLDPTQREHLRSLYVKYHGSIKAAVEQP